MKTILCLNFIFLYASGHAPDNRVIQSQKDCCSVKD
jgi:hypothetical protein